MKTGIWHRKQEKGKYLQRFTVSLKKYVILLRAFLNNMMKKKFEWDNKII